MPTEFDDVDSCLLIPAHNEDSSTGMLQSSGSFAGDPAALDDSQPAGGTPAGEMVVIGLRSCDCYAVQYPKTNSRRLPNTRMLAFDIEGLLPCDADSLAVDAIPNADGWLVVATEQAVCEPLIQQLEDAGSCVVAICPVVLLGWSAIRQRLPTKGHSVVICHSSGGFDVFHVHDRQIDDWRWAGRRLECIADATRAWATDSGATCYAVGCPADLQEAIGEKWPVEHIPLDIEQCIADGASEVASGRAEPTVNLRSGPLAARDPFRLVRGPLRFAVAMLVLLLATVSAATFHRAWRYRQESARMIALQEDAFKEVFPGEPLPVGIRARLESEHRRLAGTRGTGASAAPVVLSTVPVAHAWLSAMPEDVRYRIDRVEILPGEIVALIGTANSFSDVDRIAAALQTAGFLVPPVSTTKTPSGVSLRFENVPHGNLTSESGAPPQEPDQ